MNNKRMLIALFSDPNFLSLSVLENTLSKNCYVDIVTNDKNGWQKITEHLAVSKKFSIISPKEKQGGVPYVYSVFVCGFLNKKEAVKDFTSYTKNGSDNDSKTIAIFPHEIADEVNTSIVRVGDNAAIIYLGDVFGPRMNLDSDLFFSSVLRQIFYNKKIVVPIGEVFYPIFAADAARNIVSWLFSFGPYGGKTFLLGQQISPDELWKLGQNLTGSLNIYYDQHLVARRKVSGENIKTINARLDEDFGETFLWLEKYPPKTKFASKLKKEKSKENRLPARKIPQAVKSGILLFIFLLSFPFITVFLSGGFFYLSYKSIKTGSLDGARNSILAAKTLASIGEPEARILAVVPVFGRPYKELSFAAVSGRRIADIGLGVLPAVKSLQSLVGGVLGNSPYDIQATSLSIKSGFGILYRNMLLLQADTKEAAGSNVFLANKFLEKVDFEKIESQSQEGSILAGNLPEVLGQNGRKTYLILFENNMELRPTGGFIGSYGLLTFDKGRLSDMNISDVYSADGQLLGHVEPPTPIKNYLGEANWWLRDSNWDPDFPTSARRAEWFLDKEVGQEVDGDVAVDLNLVKDVLSATGPIFLADYNLDITGSNLYEKTQEEVQNDFFPGTHKKASFLTALSRELLSSVGDINAKNKLSMLKSLYLNLEGRHIQLFLHSKVMQAAVDNLGWSGSVNTANCGDACYADMFGLVEANLGVNKANYFITRNISLDVQTNGKEIERSASIELKNNAPSALGPSGIYKTYMRILIPKDAEAGNVNATSGKNLENLSAEITQEDNRQEVGVWLEVQAGQTKKVNFTWKSDKNKVLYGLYIRKQAGTGDDNFSLTLDGANLYNTNLTRDIWIQKN